MWMCVCVCLFFLPCGQLALILGAVIVVGVLFYIYMVWRNPKANNSLAPIAIFSLADFVSDVLFTFAIQDIEGLGESRMVERNERK